MTVEGVLKALGSMRRLGPWIRKQRKTLDEVLDQYNFMFAFFPDGSFGLGCDPNAPACLSEQDKTDIISFMQLLSFERP